MPCLALAITSNLTDAWNLLHRDSIYTNPAALRRSYRRMDASVFEAGLIRHKSS